MSTTRNRLNQVSFTKLVMWLQAYEGEQTTFANLLRKAQQELGFALTRPTLEKAVNEFDLLDKLIANRPSNKGTNKLKERVEMMELLFSELVERLEKIEEVANRKGGSDEI